MYRSSKLPAVAQKQLPDRSLLRDPAYFGHKGSNSAYFDGTSQSIPPWKNIDALRGLESQVLLYCDRCPPVLPSRPQSLAQSFQMECLFL
jgi:hypothetical protein